jgi:hypothetical protein
MATKKSTANQREDRVSTSKIPAVIAKPASPATKSSGAAPKGGGQAASGSKLVQPTVTTKISGSTKIPAPKTSTQIASDAQKILDQLGAMGQRLDALSSGDKKLQDDTDSNVVTGNDPSLSYAKAQDEKARRNAFALLKDVFNQYGLGDLSDTIETLMKEGYEPEEATLALKTNPNFNKAYITRFRGNELRRTAGLNVLSEAEYLALEDDYTKTLKSYGLESYFGVDKATKQSAIADVIGADVSAIEFTDRVSTAVDRVKMADPATKSAFQQFYGIGEADLVKYFLDPKKALVNLKEKATAAEIGGAAIGQGLAATATTAEDLARFGVTRQAAQVGYETIAGELPTATKLGQIYDEEGITYGQTEAEQATFKGLASAKRKKEQLVEREKAAFQGSSGVAQPGLSTTYMRRSSSAGYF